MALTGPTQARRSAGLAAAGGKGSSCDRRVEPRLSVRGDRGGGGGFPDERSKEPDADATKLNSSDLFAKIEKRLTPILPSPLPGPPTLARDDVRACPAASCTSSLLAYRTVPRVLGAACEATNSVEHPANQRPAISEPNSTPAWPIPRTLATRVTLGPAVINLLEV